MSSERNLPADDDKKAGGLETEGLKLLRLGGESNYRQAIKMFEEDLALRKTVEGVTGHSKHKGGAYYGLGLCYLYLKDRGEALRNLLLAYVEDVISKEQGREYEAEWEPAASMLRDLFRFDPIVLHDIIQDISEKKKLGDIVDPLVPLRSILEAKRLTLDHLETLTKQAVIIAEKTPLGFPQPRELRVFVAGKYGNEMEEELVVIKKAVLDSGLIPILAREVDTPRERTHEYALLLMHTCSRAVFEMSSPGGQYMELERTRDFNLKVLVVNRKGSVVSSMALSAPNVVLHKEYESMVQLTEYVKSFLG